MGVSLAEAFSDSFALFGFILIAACAVWWATHIIRSYLRRFD